MNDDLINDLKQFIAATVSQATAHLATKNDVDQRIAQLEERFDQRFDELDTKLTTIADAHAETLEDHEQRIGHLEAGSASS